MEDLGKSYFIPVTSEFTEDEFKESYDLLLADIKKNVVPQKYHCVIFLGGQPGAGKSYFHAQDEILNSYIVIDGDKYRRYHPHFKDIIENHLDEMADFTQDFVNLCVQRLIADLSDEGYNLIIEGTLRNPQVPINTCKMLKSKGYTADLYVIATDAVTAWESTVNRSKLLQEIGEVPRFVPIKKYNYIVKHIVENLAQIEMEKCFDQIRVISRDNAILYPNRNNFSASGTLASALDLEKWNKVFPEKMLEFNEKTEKLVEQQRRHRKHGR